MRKLLVVAGLALSFVLTGSAGAAEREGAVCKVVRDEDGDRVVLMESRWISMHLWPQRQALITRFVFRPSGNDIVGPLTPKVRKAGGAGILMDCLWEQDWRFQELAYRPYEYRITSKGPDKAQVVFETEIEGWIGANGSGVKSQLLDDMILRRTVTLKAGEPFFRFDFKFIPKDDHAKRPTFWLHNASVVNTTGTEAVLRPSQRGVDILKGPYRHSTGGRHFIRNFTEGWTARLAPGRSEGLVYLMDYDPLKMLYNNGNATTEWMYNGILAMPDNPWKGSVYILPMIGLDDVDYANEYFICSLKPTHKEGRLTLDYQVTSSYKNATRVTFNTTVEHHLLAEQKQKKRLDTVRVDGLGFEPTSKTVQTSLKASDPLFFDVTAFVETPGGGMKKFHFQSYYSGSYSSGMGMNRNKDKEIIRPLDRPIQRPRVPEVPDDISLAKGTPVRAFGVLGFGSKRMGVLKALRGADDIKVDIGFCTGQNAYGYALSDFPYAYKRLFKNQALVLANSKWTEIRRIGASIVKPWLEAGGGLVLTGGEHAYTQQFRDHEMNKHLPIEPKPDNLKPGAVTLRKPAAPDHPIFEGIDLSKLPAMPFHHEVSLKNPDKSRVLMKAGDHPFIVEHRTDGQITIAVMNNHFGTEAQLDGATHLRHWDQWPKLMRNIVRYAAHGAGPTAN